MNSAASSASAGSVRLKEKPAQAVATDSSLASDASDVSDASAAQRRRQKNKIADFIQADKVVDSIALEVPAGPGSQRIHKSLRRKVKSCLRSPWLDMIQGTIVTLDVCLGIFETDLRAAGQEIPLWISVLSDACLVAYSAEVLAYIFVKQMKALANTWVLLDVTIVIAGFSASIIQAITQLPSEGVRRFLYLFRVIRLIRVFRKFRYFRELQKLVKIIASCFRTLFWAFILCFTIMTLWAMLAVEVLSPMMESMTAAGAFADCESCSRAFSSVMRTNLTLFQTIVAGDSWGLIAIPMIEAYPISAVIFCGSLLSIVFGILNMVVAVVVDEFAERRAKDFVEMGEELENNREEDLAFLQSIFEQLDEDNDGELDFRELLSGARKLPEFCHRLRVMDIDESDLIQLFEMLDTDGSGTVGPKEFITALSRWLQDSKTASRFVKYNVMRSLESQEAMREELNAKIWELQRGLQILLQQTMAACDSPVGAQFTFSQSIGPTSNSQGMKSHATFRGNELDFRDETSDVTWSRRFARKTRGQRSETPKASFAPEDQRGTHSAPAPDLWLVDPDYVAKSQGSELLVSQIRHELDASFQKAMHIMQECMAEAPPQVTRSPSKPALGMEALGLLPTARKPELIDTRCDSWEPSFTLDGQACLHEDASRTAWQDGQQSTSVELSLS